MNNNPHKEVPPGVHILDRAERTIEVGGQERQLTPQLFAALEVLTGRPNTITGRDELAASLWPLDNQPANLQLATDKVISRLRGEIGVNFWETIRGSGWRYNPLGPTSTVDASHPATQSSILEVLDGQQAARVGGQSIPLTPKEYSLISTLDQSPGTIVTRSQVAKAIWGTEESPLENRLNQLVLRTREKIPQGENYIRTVRGRGIIFDPHGREEEDLTFKGADVDSQTLGVRLDPERQLVIVDGKPIQPSTGVFDVLSILDGHPNELVTHVQLHPAWKEPPTPDAVYKRMAYVKALVDPNRIESRQGGYIYRPQQAVVESSEPDLSRGPTSLVEFVPQRRAARGGGTERSLSPLEARVLAIFDQKKHTIVSPEDLKAAWLEGTKPSYDTIVSAVRHLRKRIGQPGIIVNAPHQGWIFHPEGEEAFLASEQVKQVRGIRPISQRSAINVEGTEHRVGPIDFEVFQILYDGAGRVIGKEQLAQAWGPQVRQVITDESITQVMKHLRKICGDRIVTVRGVGYGLFSDRTPTEEEIAKL